MAADCDLDRLHTLKLQLYHPNMRQTFFILHLSYPALYNSDLF